MIPTGLAFAFYIAKNGGWFSRAIAFWTRSKYSHSETVFSMLDSQGRRLSFSASERDKAVRLKYIQYDPEKWDFIKADCAGPVVENNIYDKCCEYVGQGYDYVGLMSFILRRVRLIRPSKTKFWCSETTEMVAAWLGMCERSKEPPSPGALYKRLTKPDSPS